MHMAVPGTLGERSRQERLLDPEMRLSILNLAALIEWLLIQKGQGSVSVASSELPC